MDLQPAPDDPLPTIKLGAHDYVRAADVVGIEHVRAAFGDIKSFSAYAAPGRGGRLVKRPADAAGAEEYVRADHVRNAIEIVIPADVVYRLPGDGNAYVALATLRRAGAEDTVLDGLKGLCCTASPDYALAPVAVRRRVGHTFVTASYAAEELPELWPRVFEMLYPGTTRAKLPAHTIRGAEGTWFSPTDLFAACSDLDLELPEGDTPLKVLEALGARDSYTCSAIIDTDGKLTKKIATSDGAAPYVSSAWLAREYVGLKSAGVQNPFRALRELVQPAASDQPILACLGARVVRKRQRKHTKAPVGTVPIKSRKKSSVKMTLAGRIKDPRARQFLEHVVDSVSAASRYGSYLINLHVMRVMDSTGGVLSDHPDDRPFDLYDMLSKSTRAVNLGAPKDPGLAATYRAFEDVLAPLVDRTIVDFGNIVTRDVQLSVQNALTTMQLAGPSRVPTLLAAAYRRDGNKAPKGAVHGLMGFVRGTTTVIADNVPERVRSLAKKYREMYDSKQLNDCHGFKVHDMDKTRARPCRARRILELYWHVNRDLVALEAEAIASGQWARAGGDEKVWDAPEIFEGPDDESKVIQPKKLNAWRRCTFAPLPVSSLKRRHVRIDREGFSRACSNMVWGHDIKGFEQESFMSLFVDNASLGKRKGALQRSKAMGWEIGDSFLTDGTSLVFTYECSLRRGKEKGVVTDDDEPLRHVSVPEGCVVVGDDTGMINVHTTCTLDGDKTPVIRQLTRNDYYRDSKLDEIRVSGERRRLHHASEAMAALSSERRRTCVASEFSRYVGVVAAYQKELKAAYGSRSATSEAFTAYRGKTGTIDRFVNLHRNRPKKGVAPEKVWYGLGDAKFNCTGRGERAVPTTSFASRMRRAHNKHFELVLVDEYMTTQIDAATGTKLKSAMRARIVDGETKYVKDHDVKLCTSEYPLESHSFLVARGAMLEGLAEFDPSYTPVSRDPNSSYAMAKLIGLTNEQRPEPYRRPTRD